MEAAGGMSGGKRNHEDLSDMMALVEAACKVLANTARPIVHIQMCSECGQRSRLWPSSESVEQSVTGVASACRASRKP